MRIFLVGGGTGGATAPLLAVGEALASMHRDIEFFVIGAGGVEKRMLGNLHVPVHYLSIPAGKWRRYASFWNFIDIFKTVFGFFRSLYLVRKYRPDIVFGAGSFVQVPVSWAAFFFKVPVVIHQQDLPLLLSNKLTCLIAQAITVSFSYSNQKLPEFSGLFKKIAKSKITVTGNPVRKEVLGGSAEQAKELFNLNDKYPTVLVTGGSIGAQSLNRLLKASLPELVKYTQVIHVTGGKESDKKPFIYPNYHSYEFLGAELKHAYAVADLVVSRGGMSTVTELSRLGKPAIIVPLPHSPQEENARFLAYCKAAVVVFEEFLNPDLLLSLVRKVLWSKEIQETLRANIQKLNPLDADKRIAKIILKACKQARENARD